MEGIILAAGFSSRYPEYKLKQRIDGQTLIEKTVMSMQPFVSRIYVVTGHHHTTIEDILENYDVTCVYNSNYVKGMFESIKTGVSCVHDDFFILPGDCGFVDSSTYTVLMDVKEKVVIPSYKHRGGHPIKLSIELKEKILTTNAPHLRAFLNEYNKYYVDVDDPYVLVDIDTKEDLEKVRREIE